MAQAQRRHQSGDCSQGFRGGGLSNEHLSSLRESALAVGDPTQFHLIYNDGKANLHVAAADRGMFHFKGTVDAPLGAVVDVRLDGYNVLSVHPRSAGGAN
jgi:hypothetical protein